MPKLLLLHNPPEKMYRVAIAILCPARQSAQARGAVKRTTLGLCFRVSAGECVGHAGKFHVVRSCSHVLGRIRHKWWLPHHLSTDLLLQGVFLTPCPL